MFLPYLFPSTNMVGLHKQDLLETALVRTKFLNHADKVSPLTWQVVWMYKIETSIFVVLGLYSLISTYTTRNMTCLVPKIKYLCMFVYFFYANKIAWYLLPSPLFYRILSHLTVMQLYHVDRLIAIMTPSETGENKFSVWCNIMRQYCSWMSDIMQALIIFYHCNFLYFQIDFMLYAVLRLEDICSSVHVSRAILTPTELQTLHSCLNDSFYCSSSCWLQYFIFIYQVLVDFVLANRHICSAIYLGRS